MSPTPVELPGWVEFNAWRTGLTPYQFASSGPGAQVRAILYLDRRGRVRLPDLATYLPVSFETQRQRPSSRTADWLEASAPLVEQMKQRAVPQLVYLPPSIDDVRPWQWRGFLVSVDYTYQIDFPFDPTLMVPSHRNSVEKAARLGMSVRRVDDVDPVVECLVESASRVGYPLVIRHDELRGALRLLGSDSLRMYTCFDKEGRPASSCVVVHAPGNLALAWLAGTRSASLGDGANHLLWRVAFDDLESAGASGVDWGGPNSRTLAEFKARWGSRLVPIYSIRTYSTRAGARFLADWIDFRRKDHVQSVGVGGPPASPGNRPGGKATTEARPAKQETRSGR